MNTKHFNEKLSSIWSIADLLRGSYCPDQYQNVMPHMTVPRRFYCVLEMTKNKVIAKQKKISAVMTGKIDFCMEVT